MRQVIALALAGALLVAVPRGLTAQSTVESMPRASDVCDVIAQAIAFLQAQPASPVRDALLAYARALQAARCHTMHIMG